MFRPLGIVVLLVAIPPAWGAAASSEPGQLRNELVDHPSAYLAMHGGDPVAWQDWGDEAVAYARAEGRLLLLSSGYFACHWCHVMQRESFQDTAIAGFLNAHYVPVKLDRELQAALDAWLIEFVERTQGRAGWPLNVVLTPDGYPLIGVTYLPPDEFRDFLARVDEAWRQDPDGIRRLARQATLQLRREHRPADVEPLSPAAIDRLLLDRAMARADQLGGGFGVANRFPKAPQLAALLDLQARRPDPTLEEFLRLTLDRMAGEGLRDHLAGGFFRYTEDPSWEVPHFEKMLYTQALLADVYLRAAEVLAEPAYADVARDTVAFLVRDMAAGRGGFVASFSALDGQGREGGYYLLPMDRLAESLGQPDAGIARRHWRLDEASYFDAGHLPKRGEPVVDIAADLQMPVADVRQRLDATREKLLAMRAERGLPVDAKVLAGWNGLVLSTLTRAARRWDDREIAAAAEATYRVLRDTFWDGARLHRALHAGQPLGKADLSDYAFVARGVRHYADWSGDQSARSLAGTLIEQAWVRFHDAGGWHLGPDPLIPSAGGDAAMPDDALPSPSALLVRLGLAHGDATMRRRAREAAEAARGAVQAEPFVHVGHLAVLQEMASDRTDVGRVDQGLTDGGR